ncbi:hypothetical protein HMI54_014184 [Coelomomyces lativittatus]|nr:hypothetical protein HMI56_004807 [Coelomomyces lativittatus]KAJ1514439.1 hypothetical protein HMI54_014184 [Coelomomyces lativittatus]
MFAWVEHKVDQKSVQKNPKNNPTQGNHRDEKNDRKTDVYRKDVLQEPSIFKQTNEKIVNFSADGSTSMSISEKHTSAVVPPKTEDRSSSNAVAMTNSKVKIAPKRVTHIERSKFPGYQFRIVPDPIRL